LKNLEHQIQGEKQNMKSNASFVFAMMVAAMIAGSTASQAGVGEAAALFPVTIPAKTGGVPGVKFVGIPVARPAIYEGLVTAQVAANSTTTTAANPAFTTVVTDANFDAAVISRIWGANKVVETKGLGANTDVPASDNNYVLEITSGPMVGLTKSVTAADVGGLTVQGGFSLNLSVNTKYVLRKDWTLGTLFGNNAAEAAAAGVTTGISSTGDNLGVIKNDILTLYYMTTAGQWRPTRSYDSTKTYQHIRVPLSGGVYVKRNASLAGTLYLSGIYRPTRLQALLEGPDNSVFAVSTPNFKDVTLTETGLHRYVRSSIANSACDEVRVVDATGVVRSYVNSAASGTGTGYTSFFWDGTSATAPSWKSTRGTTLAGSANSVVIPAGSAVLIKKESATPRLIGLDPSYTQ
jgi:hypothetical protein